MKGFWSDAVEKLIFNSRRLLSFAGEAESPMAIERVIRTVPRSDAELAEDSLAERSYCIKCLLKAHDGLRANADRHLVEELAEYFIDRLPNYSKEERNELEEAVSVLRGLRKEFRRRRH